MKEKLKKTAVAQITNTKSTSCFSQTNLPNITLTNKSSCTVNVLYLTDGFNNDTPHESFIPDIQERLYKL